MLFRYFFTREIFVRNFFTVLLLAAPTLSQAEGIDSGDTSWLLTSTALVLFMTIPGLSLFYAGLVRSKNVLSVLMQCFTITCIATLLWFAVGYSLAFTGGGALNDFFGGFSKAFFAGVERGSLSGTIPESLFIMFQLTFAIITPALIIGSFAERLRFPAILLFTIIWSLLVYFPVAHQVWGGGWLAEMGFLDFAGGAVVHMTAGVGALVAAIVLGPRIGFGKSNMAPHSMVITMAGAGMLWVGWFGFNGGSAIAANADAGMAVLVTHISAAAASISWMCMDWWRFGKPSALGIVTGMVAGLGSITPASGFVGPLGALIIGLVAGAVCFTATNFLKGKLKIDDSLDVFSVHGVGGFLGLLLLAVFTATEWGGVGFPEGGGIGEQFSIQLIGGLSVLAWTVVGTLVTLFIVKAITPLRASETEEVEGLDTTQHNESGYHF